MDCKIKRWFLETELISDKVTEGLRGEKIMRSVKKLK